tara:strand:+ start:1914 stop:2084 length:171 start_codon:yes stop_codon:yes gene_type:complete
MTDKKKFAANAEIRKCILELLTAMHDDPYPYDAKLIDELHAIANGKLCFTLKDPTD